MAANSLRHKATLKEYLMKYETVSLSIYKLTHRSGQQFTGSAVGNSQGKKKYLKRQIGKKSKTVRYICRSALKSPCQIPAQHTKPKHWTAAKCQKVVAIPGGLDDTNLSLWRSLWKADYLKTGPEIFSHHILACRPSLLLNILCLLSCFSDLQQQPK